jgi:hypothetical protein
MASAGKLTLGWSNRSVLHIAITIQRSDHSVRVVQGQIQGVRQVNGHKSPGQEARFIIPLTCYHYLNTLLFQSRLALR